MRGTWPGKMYVTVARVNIDPPIGFLLDFTSRVWLTYRSQFSIPIRDIRLGDLSMSYSWESVACPRIIHQQEELARGGGDKTWNKDSGWGCMSRTGQSLLANALVHTRLGRCIFLFF